MEFDSDTRPFALSVCLSVYQSIDLSIYLSIYSGIQFCFTGLFHGCIRRFALVIHYCHDVRGKGEER